MFDADYVTQNILAIVQQNSFIDKQISISDDLRKIGINSLNFIKMIVSIENLFNIEFPDDALCYEKYNTVIEISELVLFLLNQKEKI